MAHNRKFVSSKIGLVITTLSNSQKVKNQDRIEKLMLDSGILDGAPFIWVGLVYRYGIKNDLKPKYSKIDKKDGELEVKIELDTGILEWADENDLRLMYDIFYIAALDVLIDIGKKYGLKHDLILAERSKYGNIPNTIEECLAFNAIGPEYKIKTNRCRECGHIRKTLEARLCVACGAVTDVNNVEE